MKQHSHQDRDCLSASTHSVARNQKRFGMHGRRRSLQQLLMDMRSARSADAFDGREYRWLKGKEGRGCTAWVSREKCLIVSETETIVTVYALPRWFRSGTPMYSGKERLRKPHAYIRNNKDYGIACA